MIERNLIVTSRLGLHARAAAKLVRVASDFESSLKLRRADNSVNADAKSILSVLMLAATRETKLHLFAEGPDEREAVETISELFANDFGETDRATTNTDTISQGEIRWQGLGVCEGIVIGRVVRLHDGTRTVYRARIDDSDLARELQRFRAAARIARRQLQTIKQRAEKELGRGHGYIFDAHLLFLEDPQLIGEIEAQIIEKHANAEWAVKVVGDRLLSVYSEIKDDYLRERGSDIEDVAQRLLVNLSGEQPEYSNLSEDAVIVSPDLLPSAVAELNPEHARAIATDTGGWTSHMAILARGLGIPCVVGLRDFYRRTRTGDEIIVDSYRGEVILHPSSATVERYKSETEAQVSISSPDFVGEAGPVTTRDGVNISLRANVELPAEFARVRKFGAQGVGLYRSEFLLTRPGVMLSEEEQYLAYKELAHIAGRDGAIVRLFDLGGEIGGELPTIAERNPALGLRAIRFALRHQDLMRTQLRAILRAAASGRLDIVLPMVADVGDVRKARQLLVEEKERLKAEGLSSGSVRVGAMIEVPSAVLTAERIARVVDFFELGTNDLVQYTLAVDRGNDNVSEWFRTLHPAVIYGIKLTLQAAQLAGIPAIVCGEMASTPAYAVLLVGLGAVDLSMTPSAIPRVRRVLAGIDSQEAQAIAEKCLECETADDVEDLVRESFRAYWPRLFTEKSLPARRDAK